MKKIALLTCGDLTDFCTEEHLVHKALREQGVQTQDVVWNQSDINWNDFDAAIIRTTWDYTKHLHHFLKVLEQIEQSTCDLYNPFSIVKWNSHKSYLSELEKKGIPIVPTKWIKSLAEKDIENLETKMILKPQVSANADNTFILDPSGPRLQLSHVLGKEMMLQPFLESIKTKGESSLFFFEGEYSHAVKKIPQSGDFRVQEEHGGQISSYTPLKEEKTLAQKIMNTLDEKLLYARVDLVSENDQFYLMELELVEPSLYLTFDEKAPGEFAKRILHRLRD